MKIVAMMRVKDAILTIHECLTNLSRLVDEIVIVDNGSTDGTLESYAQFPKIVDIAHTEGYDEGRDRALYLKMAKKRNPDWLLWIDSDEIFEQHANRKDLEKLMNRNDVNQISFRMYNFYFSKRQFRIDGTNRNYATWPQRSAWRNSEEAFFRNQKVHCGDVRGVDGRKVVSKIRIMHFTAVNQKQARQKAQIYASIKDPSAEKSSHYKAGKMSITLPWIESNNPYLNHAIQYCFDALFFILWKYDLAIELIHKIFID